MMNCMLLVQGYTELLDLMGQHAQREGPGKAPNIDCYGNGNDLQEVAAASAAKQLPLSFLGARDHLDDSMHEYKVSAAVSRLALMYSCPSPSDLELTVA